MNTRQRIPRFDRRWDEIIALYPDESVRVLLTSAIKRYQLDGTEPQLPAELMVAFEFLRPTIDRRARNRARRLARLTAKSPSIPTTAVGSTGRSTDTPLVSSAPLLPSPPSAPALKITLPDNTDRFLAPDESDMPGRFKFWNEFTKSRTSNLTQKEIDNDRFAFETDVWDNESSDIVPDHPDGSPMLYSELVQHYCGILRHDKPVMLRISDEVARLTGVLFRTDDLRGFIDSFCTHSTRIPIINLNRTTCRRAFIRYMINYATRYRTSLRQ